MLAIRGDPAFNALDHEWVGGDCLNAIGEWVEID
jgi:hypothetical protein